MNVFDVDMKRSLPSPKNPIDKDIAVIANTTTHYKIGYYFSLLKLDIDITKKSKARGVFASANV